MELIWAVLETDSDGRWSPGIGDPSLLGWVSVAAYASAAYFAFTAARACRGRASALQALDAREAANQRTLTDFWLFAALAMALLGINKQLDLQSLFTQVMRDMAVAQGWYEDRQKYQVAFIAGIAAIALLGVCGLAYRLRRVISRVWLAVLGLGWILAFVLIRAASFHHVDALLRGGSVRWNGVFELSGIAMIGICGRRAAASSPKPSPRAAN